MTMILTVLGSDTGLFALGDVLVSAPGGRRVGLPLPLQFEPVSTAAAEQGVAGFAQKLTIVSAKVLVSWSGSYAVARALIAAIQAESREAHPVDLAAVVRSSGLAEAELAEVSIILHQTLGEQVEITCFNARRGQVQGVAAAWEGTGAYDFLEDTVIEAGGSLADFRTVLRGMMLRVATTLAAETMDQSTYAYCYGGWFELVISRTLGLRKIPYAMKYGGRRGSEYGYDAPLFFNWYKGKSLFICSLDQKGGSSDVRVLEVPDLLSKKQWRPVRCKPICRPEFTFHVVLDEDTGHREIHVSDRHSDGHIDVHVGKRGSYTMKVNRSFIDRVMSRAAVPDFTIHRASEVYSSD